MSTFTEQLVEMRLRMEENEQIFKDLFAKHGIPTPPCGCYFGRGWLSVIDETFGKMIAAGWNKELAQVKSKFCGLRIYIEYPAPFEVSQIIKEAEVKCSTMCEDCGAPHGLSVPRAGRAQCPVCVEKSRDSI